MTNVRRAMMSTKRSDLKERLSEPTEELICDVGEEANLFWLFNEYGQYRDLMLVRMGRPRRPGPYPGSFYSAQKWFRRNRVHLLKHIVEDFDYGAKRDQYPRGRESELVADLAKAIAPACQEPHPVDPVLAAATLVRMGLDNFCEGYDEPGVNHETWSLERALGIDPTKANELAGEANGLLGRGRWQDAVPLLERALLLCPVHLDALNDLTYIYGSYYPKCDEGLEYARQLYRWTAQGDSHEPEIFDTIGWAGFKHGGEIDLCEDCLRYSINGIGRLETGYISACYHLMAVLKARGKDVEAKEIFDRIRDLPPTNVLDTESLGLARQLLGF